MEFSITSLESLGLSNLLWNSSSQFTPCDSVLLSFQSNIPDVWIMEESAIQYLCKSTNWEAGLQCKLGLFLN